MPKALSFDLRSRVLAAIDAGLSCRQAAARFGVSASSAIRWQGMRRAGGDARPKPQGGDRLSRRTEAHAELIHAALAAVPDITLPELKARLAEKGARVSVSALWRFCRRHKITRKKRPRTRPSRTGRISASDARPGSRASSTLIPRGWCSSTRPGLPPPWPGATGGLRGDDAFGSVSRTGAGRQPPLWPGCARAALWHPSCSMARSTARRSRPMLRRSSCPSCGRAMS
jgi:transposase